MSIMNVLDLSTAHLNTKDSRLLTDACDYIDDHSRCPVRVATHQHGWILFLGDSTALDDKGRGYRDRSKEMGYSDVFVAVLDYAYQHDCQLVNFDADGDVVDGLAVGDFG